MKIKKKSAFLVLLLGICMMGYAYVQLAETNQINQECNAVYEDLSNRVKDHTTADSPAQQISDDKQIDIDKWSVAAEEPTEAEKMIYIPGLGVNFDTLKKISDDAAAWLYCPDTVIDYPVMKAGDYAYYLYRLPDGTQNANGSLFIDFNCAPDFSDQLTVIYGHHMRSKMMFGSLVEYKSQRYYDEHPFMYLYTEENNYRIDLLYGCVIGAGQWRERAFMYKENVDALIAYAAHNTTFESNAVYAEGERIVAMSTCSYEFENARYVVIGILREEY